MTSERKKSANRAKAKRSGTVSTVTEPLSIRIPRGLDRAQRSEARKVAQDAVTAWRYNERMKEGLR